LSHTRVAKRKPWGLLLAGWLTPWPAVANATANVPLPTMLSLTCSLYPPFLSFSLPLSLSLAVFLCLT